MLNIETILLNINKLKALKKIRDVEIANVTGYGRPRVATILKGESEMTVRFLLAIEKLSGINLKDILFDDRSDDSNISIHLDKIMELSRENVRLQIKIEELEKELKKYK